MYDEEGTTPETEVEPTTEEGTEVPGEEMEGTPEEEVVEPNEDLAPEEEGDEE